MSKVALITVSDNNEYFVEHIGIARIDAYLHNHGIVTKLIHLETTESVNGINDLFCNIDLDYDIIGFSVFNTNAEVIYELARLIKKQQKANLIIAGGLFSTICCDCILNDCSYIDLIVLGEGEETMLDIVSNKNKGMSYFKEHINIKTRIDSKEKVPATVNFDKLPYPTRNFVDSNKKQYLISRINASRGCVGNCRFCSASKKIYKKWEGREISDTVCEINQIYTKYGIRAFHFSDNSLEDPGTIGKKRIEEFCKSILESSISFHFWCFLKANTFTEKDVNLLKLMRQAGFTIVFIGIESNNEDDLLFYGKSANLQDNIRTMKLFSDADIEIEMGFIMFNPYSTIENIKKNYIFLKDNKTMSIGLYYYSLEIQYGTEIYYEAKNNNILSDNYSYINTRNYRFVNKDVEILSNFIKKEIIENDTINILEQKIRNFNRIWFLLKALFPDEIIKFEEAYMKNRNELANEITKMFDIIFIENDYTKSKKCLPEFLTEIKKFNLKFDILLNKLVRNETIRNFMENNKSRITSVE